MADVEWRRKVRPRPGQAHAFGAAGRPVCGSVYTAGEWETVDTTARRCASCRQRIDPASAPRAPTWRGE